MSRVRHGPASRHRHKKVIALARGHKGLRHRLFRRARESVTHALAYAYRDRRNRKRQFRQLWITRINAAARLHGLTYGRLIDGLHRAGVQLDRKALAELAVRDPTAFASVAQVAQAALSA